MVTKESEEVMDKLEIEGRKEREDLMGKKVGRDPLVVKEMLETKDSRALRDQKE